MSKNKPWFKTPIFIFVSFSVGPCPQTSDQPSQWDVYGCSNNDGYLPPNYCRWRYETHRGDQNRLKDGSNDGNSKRIDGFGKRDAPCGSARDHLQQQRLHSNYQQLQSNATTSYHGNGQQAETQANQHFLSSAMKSPPLLDR